MPYFIVKAKLTKDYEVSVEAEDEMDAIKKLDDWMADDFEDFETGACWDFEGEEDTRERPFGAFGILKHETKPELVFDSERRFITEAEGVEWINGEEGELYAEGFHDEFDKEEYLGYWLDDIVVRAL